MSGRYEGQAEAVLIDAGGDGVARAGSAGDGYEHSAVGVLLPLIGKSVSRVNCPSVERLNVTGEGEGDRGACGQSLNCGGGGIGSVVIVGDNGDVELSGADAYFNGVTVGAGSVGDGGSVGVVSLELGGEGLALLSAGDPILHIDLELRLAVSDVDRGLTDLHAVAVEVDVTRGDEVAVIVLYDGGKGDLLALVFALDRLGAVNSGGVGDGKNDVGIDNGGVDHVEHDLVDHGGAVIRGLVVALRRDDGSVAVILGKRGHADDVLGIRDRCPGGAAVYADLPLNGVVRAVRKWNGLILLINGRDGKSVGLVRYERILVRRYGDGGAVAVRDYLVGVHGELRDEGLGGIV